MSQRGLSINLFRLSLPLITIIAVTGLISPQSLASAASVLTTTVFAAVDWFYVASATAILVLAIWLALSRHGELVLGQPHDKPEFSTGSWLAMLFAAGIGSGILFWSVAEPMTHYMGAPGIEAETPYAARNALTITGLHWGLHAWGIYAMASLVLAFFAFRRDRPYLPGAPIRDVFPFRWAKSVAFLADLIAVLAIVFGVAASIAMGTMQLQAGLHVIFGLSVDSKLIATFILCALFAAYMTSAATSLDKGIKWLSNINVILAIVLAVFVLVVGPTSYILKTFMTAFGDYVSSLPRLSMKLYAHDADQSWVHDWTITYLIWWIAWAPFVGIFIARISRGRTIREFIYGVLFVPTIFSLLWFSIFGGAGLYEELHGAGGIGAVVQEDVSLALFALFDGYPISQVLSMTAILLVFIFLVTSVDSATFVLGMLTSEGSVNPPRARRIAWGVLLGVMGGALTLAGSVEAVRALAIMGAIPFSFVLLLQIVAFLKALFDDQRQSQ